MAVKTPEDRALADVERAINAHEKAREKREALQEKADEAYAAEKRALRELTWRASHPDLPEEFTLEEFRKQLEAPFDDRSEDEVAEDEANDIVEDVEAEAEAIGDAVESGEIDPDELEADEDDPFGDD